MDEDIVVKSIQTHTFLSIVSLFVSIPWDIKRKFLNSPFIYKPKHSLLFSFPLPSHLGQFYDSTDYTGRSSKTFHYHVIQGSGLLP